MSSSPRVSKAFDTDKRWMVVAAEASVASIILSAKMRSLEAGVDLIAILGRLPQGRGTWGWGWGANVAEVRSPAAACTVAAVMTSRAHFRSESAQIKRGADCSPRLHVVGFLQGVN